MAIGSGLAAQVGGKKESAYGTRVVPDQFWELESEGFQLQKKFLESKQLRAGRSFQSGSRRVATTRMAPGTLGGEVPMKGFGFFADLLHGNTVTPVQQGATTAYLQTHNIGASDPNKHATIQVGKPDTGGAAASGTVRPHDYLGCMVTQIEVNSALDAFLKFALQVDAQDEKTDQTLAVASYPAGQEGYNFQQATITVNGVAQTFVLSWSLTIQLARAIERFYLRSSPLKSKPIQNAYAGAAGSLTFEYIDQVQYGLFTTAAKVPLVVDFTSTTLAGSGFPFRITFTMPQVQFTGSTPVVAGPDLLTFDAPFEILDDGTNPPIKIEIMDTVSTAL